MSRVWGRILLVVALTWLAPSLVHDQQGANAQGEEAQTFFPFSDQPLVELITSTVQLVACEELRPSHGDIDLETLYDTWSTMPCGTGSGTVIHPSGIILTNAHVALDETQEEPLWVLVRRTVDARSLPQDAYFARGVLFSPAWGVQRSFGSDNTYLDLAVIVPALTLDGSPIQPGDVTMRPLPMAAEGTVTIGDELRNIGYPGIGGELITVTQGAVSGFEQDEDVSQLGMAGWIKTDATLGGGISGGTTINADGLMIGVPTELGDTEVRQIDDESGGLIPAPVGQINHIRPIPEGFDLLSDVGLGDGMPDLTVPDTAAAVDGVTLTGTVVSADTGQPVGGAWFIVLEPGIPVADYENGRQDAVYTFATSGADGSFQLKKPVTRGEAYGIMVIARGYVNTREDGRVLAPADAPAVMTLPPVQMVVQR
jgi:hypothetical protein